MATRFLTLGEACSEPRWLSNSQSSVVGCRVRAAGAAFIPAHSVSERLFLFARWRLEPGKPATTQHCRPFSRANVLRSPVMVRESPLHGWYYKQEGRTFGPLSVGQVVELLGAGHVHARQVVWNQGQGRSLYLHAGTLAHLVKS
jgi:hypothetical protein